MLAGLRAELAALAPGIAKREDVRALLGPPQHPNLRPRADLYVWNNVDLVVLVRYDDAGLLLERRETSRALITAPGGG